MKLYRCRLRWLAGILAAMTLFTASALHLQVVSFTSDGTLVWTNDQTNIFCSIQYTPNINQAWQTAPGPLCQYLQDEPLQFGRVAPRQHSELVPAVFYPRGRRHQ
jgi:hypothetical protein